MRVRINAGSLGKKYLGAKTLDIEVPEDMSAIESAVLAGIPEEEIGIITRGGSRIDFSERLVDGDDIHVYPEIISG